MRVTGHRGGPTYAPLVALVLLASLTVIGCGGDEPLVDRGLAYVQTATHIVIDSGTTTEVIYRGDSIGDFLDGYRRDTFRPGPYSTRIETACRPGTITIGRARYRFSLCRTTHRSSLTIDLDTGFVRLVGG